MQPLCCPLLMELLLGAPAELSSHMQEATWEAFLSCKDRGGLRTEVGLNLKILLKTEMLS